MPKKTNSSSAYLTLRGTGKMAGVNIDLRYLIYDLRAVGGAGARGVARVVVGSRRRVAGDKAVTCHRSPNERAGGHSIVLLPLQPVVCEARGSAPRGWNAFYLLPWVAFTATHVSSLRDFRQNIKPTKI
jgi:hypothetical protein